MVSPSAVETRNRKKSLLTAHLNGKTAQRIPSRPGVMDSL
jgi:hypothetical protein